MTVPNVTYQVPSSSVLWFWRRYLKVFSIYGHGSDIGHETQLICTNFHSYVVGWSGGAMWLGKLPVLGRPTIWISVGQGPTALAVGAGGGCFTFLL